jgi:hypothetical protein
MELSVVNLVDVHVGQRVRQRRSLLGMTMLHRDNFHWPRAPQALRNQHGSPLRLLVSSYGLAAAAAVLAVFAGAGFVASLLLFWLGGAVTVFALALIPTARKPNNACTDRARAACQSRSKKGPRTGGIVGHSACARAAPWRECSPYPNRRRSDDRSLSRARKAVSSGRVDPRR